MADPPIGILLMALGGPDSLDAVEPFLHNVRHGRPTPKEMVLEFRERYAKIGGKSPLLDISLAQARALEQRLVEGGSEALTKKIMAGKVTLHETYDRIEMLTSFRCYVGMRHWSPFIRDVVARIAGDRVERIVGLCLTPYFSRMSVGAYFADLERAIAASGAAFDLSRVESWNDRPELVRAYADKIRGGLARLASLGHHDPIVLFTAHSLPQKIMDDGDPYERELQETKAAILSTLPPIRSRLCYQSAGRTGEPWLGPPLQDVLEDLGRDGERAVLVAPFGFVSDHLEILYDVDIEAAARARNLGIHLERTESLNVDPLFIEAMASAVSQACRDANWIDTGRGT